MKQRLDESNGGKGPRKRTPGMEGSTDAEE